MQHFDERATVTEMGARRPEPGIAMAVLIAVVTFLVAAGKVAVWANRWYIAERVYYPHVDEAAKTGPYWDITQLLRSGNVALLQGFVMLATSLVFVGLATVLRRHGRTGR